MPTSWPPASAPAWPQIEASSLDYLISGLRADGWANAAPSGAERGSFFDAARCDLDHPVVGRMLVSPSGTRYPFAVCNTQHGPGLDSRAFFFLWEPFYRNDWRND